MIIAPHASKRNPQGFSYIEGLVASLVLLFAATMATRLFTDFSSRFQASRQRDSIQALVTRDLGQLRLLVNSYCRLNENKANTGPLMPCIGEKPTQDWNGAYNPDDSVPNGDCDSGLLAEAMVASNPDFFPLSITLDQGTISSPLSSISITRTLTPTGSELTATYVSRFNDQIKARTATTLVPPALGWCP
jgi:hypothetical protein